MDEKARCPYCGEEILAGAKKCKHCGEWLEERDADEKVLSDVEIKQIAEEAANEVVAEYEKTEKHAKVWAYIVGFVALAAIMFFTTPTEDKHIAKAQEYADEYSSLLIKALKQLALENKPALYTVSDLVPEELCNELRRMTRKEVVDSFKYTNCLLYSVGDIDDETTQIGVFGFVIDFTPIDESEIKEVAVEIWNEIIEEHNKDVVDTFLDILSGFNDPNN